MNTALRYTAILLICAQVALSLFFFLESTSTAFTDFYAENARALGLISNVLYYVLGLLFAYYCYIKNYLIVYYGILTLLLLNILSHFNPDLGIMLIDFRIVLVIGHAATIMATNARQNVWLRAYALLIIATGVLTVAGDVIAFLKAITPVLFIAMLLKEMKDEKNADAEILDN